MKLRAVSKALPKRVVNNQELACYLETNDEWIQSRTGIQQRYLVESESLEELCVMVAKDLLAQARLAADELDFIFIATMTPDYATPSVACLVQGKLGASKAFAMDVSAACSGFIYGLATAEKFINSGNYQRGLVIGADIMSRLVNWQDRSTAILFGDGAAGVLVEASDTSNLTVWEESLGSDGSCASHLKGGGATTFHLEGDSSKVELDFLTMNGREIFNFVSQTVAENITTLFDNSSVAMKDLDYVLAHQANQRLLAVLSKKTGIPETKFLSNIADYGNTSAASIPLLLADKVLERQLVLGSQQKVLLTGFGGGLTWGSILLNL
ncbi:beta-ketoacyl-ACP synthase III [Vagococcus intermedius]|uniref:Beta-ketoacyl-[acyl-carrier-protein] synthase III n=1 Tax=Vagococcus intermedius TaxID=2991418 RepID=A0AAF0CU00_9ENTE|nr:beta-ketoacyl-ACP synthase III [Vagococcus intermedius]WEG72821.1 ketoacyl-ACP synthase III [Vagococcus intermedius]WEG74907.1 ketoacyl-ACP synthase III [Vagococcus intermedius]